MNVCLVDAVIYAGPNGDRMRNWMRAEICKELGGKENGSGVCGFSSPMTNNASVVLVSESLGSKMVFDAVRDIWSRTAAGQRSILADRLSRVQMMEANQIPILDTATQGQATPLDRLLTQAMPYQSSFSEFLKVLGEAKRRRSLSRHAPSGEPPQSIHVVAFTDPNDLLSYRLTSDNLKVPSAIVTKVIVSNDDTYFGYLERPDLAHCGYSWNNSVIGTIILGYHGSAFRPYLSTLSIDADWSIKNYANSC